ncbi:hypothetical protein OK016_01760 [Vibrio chagasii]|nr:hypothetical protein [Vibrio chagasii]
MFSIGAIVLLGYAFVGDDFSILYVAEHSNNTQLPTFFKWPLCGLDMKAHVGFGS